MSRHTTTFLFNIKTSVSSLCAYLKPQCMSHFHWNHLCKCSHAMNIHKHFIWLIYYFVFLLSLQITVLLILCTYTYIYRCNYWIIKYILDSFYSNYQIMLVWNKNRCTLRRRKESKNGTPLFYILCSQITSEGRE